ncbi:MAG: lysylphosphatidylglycerol synthase transmembrane domain-containing protein [Thermoanaerobaculia bacterium]
MSPAAGKRLLQILLGSAVAVVLVWIAFRGTDWEAVFATLRRVDPRWILLSQALLIASHLLRAGRWTAIIRATRSITYRTALSVAQIGFLFNVILPMRLGEGVRAVLLARWTGSRISTGVALVALDRASDLLGFLFVALIALVAFPAGRDVVVPVGALHNTEPWVVSGALLRPLVLGATVALAAAVAVLLVLYVNQSRVIEALECWSWLPHKLRLWLRGAATGFAAGMGVFGSRRKMIASTALSVVSWLLAVAALACLAAAFGLEVAWYVPFVMQTMIALFVVAPVAPGLLGQFHLGVIACLLIAVPGIDLTQARAVAIGTHFFSILPVVVLGALCLARERSRWSGAAPAASDDEA